MMRCAVYVFIDAFGWQLLQTYPFLNDRLSVRQPVETIFGYSSTCDPTILTGVLPREHGHFSFYVYDPANSPFRALKPLAILPSGLTDRGRVRRVLSRWLQRRLGYTGYFQLYAVPFRWLPLFDYTEKRDLYQPGGIIGGQPTVFDYLRAEKIPFCLSDWRLPEAQNLESAESALRSGEPRFVYLYLASMDAVLHAEGCGAPAVARKVNWYAEQLTRLFDAASRYQELRITVFSDHGMTDVHQLTDPISALNRAGLRLGEDYMAMFDSTMARFWFLKPALRERIEQVMEGCEGGAWLDDDTLQSWGCDFPQRRYGEAFWVCDPHVLLCPSFMGRQPLKGMHGYRPTHEDSTAMLCRNTPDGPLPRRLDGMYALMRHDIQWAAG